MQEVKLKFSNFCNDIDNKNDRSHFLKFINPLLPLIENSITRSLHLIAGQFDLKGLQAEDTYIYNALIRVFFFESNKQYTVVTDQNDAPNLPWYSYEALPNSLKYLTDEPLNELMEAVQTSYYFIKSATNEPIFDLDVEDTKEFEESINIIMNAYFRFRIDFLISGVHIPNSLLADKDFRLEQWKAFKLDASFDESTHINLSIFDAKEVSKFIWLKQDSIIRAVNRKYNRSKSRKPNNEIGEFNQFKSLKQHGIQYGEGINNYLDGVVAADYMMTCDGYYEPTQYYSTGFANEVPIYVTNNPSNFVDFSKLIQESLKYIGLLQHKKVMDQIGAESALTTVLIKKFIKGDASLFMHQAVRLDQALSILLNLKDPEPFSFYNYFKTIYTKNLESKEIAYQRFNQGARNFF